MGPERTCAGARAHVRSRYLKGVAPLIGGKSRAAPQRARVQEIAAKKAGPDRSTPTPLCPPARGCRATPGRLSSTTRNNPNGVARPRAAADGTPLGSMGGIGPCPCTQDSSASPGPSQHPGRVAYPYRTVYHNELGVMAGLPAVIMRRTMVVDTSSKQRAGWPTSTSFGPMSLWPTLPSTGFRRTISSTLCVIPTAKATALVQPSRRLGAYV